MPTAANQLDLIVDAAGNRLLGSFTSARAAGTLPALTFGDSLPVTVRVVKKATSADPNLPWEEVDLTNHNVRLGIGNPGGDPTSGTFTLTFNSNTTSALAYNASASAVQSALNALATVQAAGNTTVTAATGGGYRVIFGSVGARNAITADATALYPTSGIYINEAQTGNATLKEVQLIRLETKPAAYVQLTDTLPAAAASITTVQGGVTNTTPEIQRLTLDPEPYGGTFTLTTPLNSSATGALDHDIAASALQSALIATDTTNLTGKVTVTGQSPQWDIQFASSLGNVGTLSATVTGLNVPTGRKGNLNLNVAGIQELLAGGASASAKLEVELYNTVAATSWTPLQATVTVREDVVPSSPSSTTPLPTFLTDTIGGTFGGGTFLTFSAGGSNTAQWAFTSTDTLQLAAAGQLAQLRIRNSWDYLRVDCTNVGMAGLPTSDPGILGRLWVDTAAGNVVKQSQG